MLSIRHIVAGFTLLELIVTLVLAAVIASLAAPSVAQTVRSIRGRSALNELTGELYRARMLAVDGGFAVRVVLSHGPDGCTRAIRTLRDLPDGGRREVARHPFELPGLCIRHTGDSILVFDGRGMLRPPARSFSVANGAVSDRVILSIAGRIRRTF